MNVDAWRPSREPVMRRSVPPSGRNCSGCAARWPNRRRTWPSWEKLPRTSLRIHQSREICGDGRGVRELRSEAHRSEEHTSELQSRQYLVCRLLLEKKKKIKNKRHALRFRLWASEFTAGRMYR